MSNQASAHPADTNANGGAVCSASASQAAANQAGADRDGADQGVEQRADTHLIDGAFDALGAFKQGLAELMGPEAFRAWGENLGVLQADDERVVLAAPSPLHVERLADKVGPRKLSALWGEADRFKRRVKLEVGAPLVPSRAAPLAPSIVEPDALAEAAAAPTCPPAVTRDDAGLSFDDFVVGDANKVACAFARAIVETEEPPARLGFIHGPFGSGKTHILRASAQAIDASGDGRRALYFNADRYRAEFVKSLSARWASDFKDGVASVDCLFVDDLHLLGGSPKTSQELYLAINEILSEGGRVIVAADRPLEKLDELEPRLRARLQGAVSCTLTKPDLPHRRRILERMAHRLPVARTASVPPEVFDFIASAVPGTPRELEAALGTVITKTVLIDQPLTRDSAREALMEMTTGVSRKVTVEDIQKTVAAHHGLKVSDLLSKRRTRDIVRPRQQAMFLCKEFTARSLPDIASRFGGMDHTTVMHACKRIKKLFTDDPSVRADIEDLRRSLRQRGGDRSALQ